MLATGFWISASAQLDAEATPRKRVEQPEKLLGASRKMQSVNKKSESKRTVLRRDENSHDEHR
jgi:hypothetical protein